MFHVLGQIKAIQRTLDGRLTISFDVDEEQDTLERVQGLLSKQITLEGKIYRPKRSLSANGYFWALCGEIAKVLGTDKDTVYLMMLQEAGKSEIYEIIAEAVPTFKSFYRYCVERYEYAVELADGVKRFVGLECFIGSSEYTTAEMAKLIDYTVQEAKALNISTWSEEEIDNLIRNWEGSK